MRLLLLADGGVGDAIARWLVENHPNDIGLLVTTCENGIATAAREAAVAHAVFESAEQICELAAKHQSAFDLGVLAWWPKIIREPLLSLPSGGFVNTHPSLLPYNRGKHYNFWAIVEQAPFGVTLHVVDRGIDTGDVLFQSPIPCDWEDTGGSLYSKAMVEMVALFQRSYPALRSMQWIRKPQDTNAGSFHRSSELEQASQIDLNKTYLARDLLNLLRARTFSGRPACTFRENGETFEVTVEIKRKSE